RSHGFTPSLRAQRSNPVRCTWIASSLWLLAMPGCGASIHMLAAVDAQRAAGDEAAFLGAEKEDAPGDLAGLAEPADRDFGDDLLQHVGRHRRDHVGVDIAGRDRVDGD